MAMARRSYYDVAAKCRDDAQHLFKLERWLTRFKLDDEANADAAYCRKLCLLQLLPFAFAAHDKSKRSAVHITERDNIVNGGDLQPTDYRAG